MDNTITTTVLLRTGNTKDIEENFKNKTLTFSCPANWICYNYMHKNYTIGDVLECVFAHVEIDDPLLEEITNCTKWNVVHKIPTNIDTFYLRSSVTILSPTLCFFHLNANEMADKLGVDIKRKQLYLDLDKYLEVVGYKASEASYLIITDAKAFGNDLRNAIPHAIDKSDRLTDKFAPVAINKENCLATNLIEYTIPEQGELFNHANDFRNSIFKKSEKYSMQSELRLVINGVTFKQDYHYQDDYNYKKNTLDVYLPNLHNYAIMFSAKDIRKLSFSEYNTLTGGYKFIALTDN